jgi:hypothetical protein
MGRMDTEIITVVRAAAATQVLDQVMVQVPHIMVAVVEPEVIQIQAMAETGIKVLLSYDIEIDKV